MILHCDGNSFYASCEQIFRPDLRGKPVAVLSNNDGIIITLNKEAKATGIKRGDPFFRVRDICVGAAPTKTLAKLYNKNATVQELNGISCIDKITREKKEVITSSKQFSKRIYDIPTLECAIVQYAELAVERLRQQDSECGAVSIYISTCNYYSDNPDEQYSNGAIIKLPRMTSYTPDIVAAARVILPHIFREGYGYKSILVTLMDIYPAAFQGNLWIDPREDIKKRSFMESVDAITQKYGRGSITLAKGFEKQGWEMKRKFLSPCWTTRYQDIPKVH